MQLSQCKIQRPEGIFVFNSNMKRNFYCALSLLLHSQFGGDIADGKEQRHHRYNNMETSKLVSY
jgi:hypothetical protein